jgi:hypothetical protein
VAKYYTVSRSPTGDLVVTADPSAPVPMPPKVVEFLGKIVATDDQVADEKVVTDSGRRQRYAAEILSYAQTGLEYGDVDTASVALDWFQRRVTEQEGPFIRKRHLLATLGVAAVVGIPGAILAILLPHLFPIPGVFAGELDIVRAGLWLAVGNALGVTFFAFLRNTELKFDQLSKFDPANLDPWLRFGLVWTITLILALLLLPKLIVVQLGNTPLNNFAKEPLMAIIIGILCGYSDNTVSNMIAGVLTPKAK